MSAKIEKELQHINIWKAQLPILSEAHYPGSAAVPILIRAASNPDRIHLISMGIFLLSMCLLYAASTTYHWLDLTPRMNRILLQTGSTDDFLL